MPRSASNDPQTPTGLRVLLLASKISSSCDIRCTELKPMISKKTLPARGSMQSSTRACFGFAEIVRACWQHWPATGLISSSASLPERSPLRRHLLPALPLQVAPQLLGVEAQSLARLTHTHFRHDLQRALASSGKNQRRRCRGDAADELNRTQRNWRQTN
jgi:hypothetical protein